MINKNFLLALALTAATSALAASRTPGDPTPLVTRPQDQLLAVLKSEADTKPKMDACRELAVVGTGKAVPTLVALLADEKLNHYARYALETMPDAGVNPALRSQLPKLQGRQLAGVITTLGVRKDTGSVGALKKFLGARDSDVVQAAARSLSRIGTGEAAKALQAAIPAAAVPDQLALYESWLRAADALAAKGDRPAALTIYDQVRATRGLPAQVRMGAVRSAILARGTAGHRLLTECLWTGDYTIFAGAVEAAMEMRAPEVTAILAACAVSLKPDNQILILQALGRRGADAVPALADFAEATTAPVARRGRRANAADDVSAKTAVRLAAVRALAETDQPTALPVLVGLLKDADKEIAQAAEEGLAALTGKEADAAALELVKSPTPAERLTGLGLIGSRRMTGAMPALMNAVADTDAAVRHAGLKRWGELAAPSDVTELLNTLRPVADAGDLGAAEAALTELCRRAEKPEEICEELIGALAEATPAQKAGLIGVLGSAGAGAALPAIRSALGDVAEVRAAAVKALAEWPEAGVLPDLLSLARSGNEAEKGLALRGYVRLAGESSVAPAEKARQMREAAALAATTADKRILLGGLGEITASDALALAAAYLADAALADEAGAAAVKIATKLPAADKEAIGVALNQVLRSAKSEPVLDKARKRLTELGLKPD